MGSVEQSRKQVLRLRLENNLMGQLTEEERREILEFLKTYKGATIAGRWLRNTIVALAGLIIAWKVLWEFFE